MNTENNSSSQTNMNPTPPSSVPAQPSTPGQEMSPPPNKSPLANMRVIVVLIAVLALAGGAAFLAFNQNKEPTPTNEAPISDTPSATINPSGLQIEVSDDPEILEQELNEVNIDNIDEEINAVNEDVNNL